MPDLFSACFFSLCPSLHSDPIFPVRFLTQLPRCLYHLLSWHHFRLMPDGQLAFHTQRAHFRASHRYVCCTSLYWHSTSNCIQVPEERQSVRNRCNKQWEVRAEIDTEDNKLGDHIKNQKLSIVSEFLSEEMGKSSTDHFPDFPGRPVQR